MIRILALGTAVAFGLPFAAAVPAAAQGPDIERGTVHDTFDDDLYLDLCGIVGSAYAAMEPSQIEGFFADKGTHTNHEGALFNAKCVIAGLRGLPGKPVDAYLNEEGSGIRPAR